jgi:hypothetical protein
MRPELRPLMEPMDPQRHLPPRADTSPHRLSELIVRVEQVAQRLQHFQHRFRTQLSQVDQGWLHQAQEQVAFYLAELSQLDDRCAVVLEAPAPLQEVASLERLARQLLQLAQAAAPMAQTRPVPRQETQRRGRAAAGERTPRSASRTPGIAVHAILIVLGEARDTGSPRGGRGWRRGRSGDDQGGSSADPGLVHPRVRRATTRKDSRCAS